MSSEQSEGNVAEEKQKDAKQVVKKGGIGVALAIVLSLTWYLLADRYTPYTSQARIEGYVVGVAPEVAGTVTRVWARNNQEVEKASRCSKSTARSTRSRWTGRGPISRTPAGRSEPAAKPSMRLAPTCSPRGRTNARPGRMPIGSNACTRKTRARFRFAASKFRRRPWSRRGPRSPPPRPTSSGPSSRWAETTPPTTRSSRRP